MASIRKLLARALDLHQRGELAAAGEIYRQILKKDPANADALNLLGVALHQVRDLDTAEQLLRRAVGHAADFAPAWVNLGNVLQDAGKAAEAAEAFSRALKLQPKLAEAESNLASALNDMGRHGEAAEAARRALDINPSLAPALNNLGNALMKLQVPVAAAEQFRKARDLRPDDPKYHRNLGSALLEAGDAAGAVPALTAAVRLLPSDAEANYNLGNAYLALDRFEDGARAFEAAIVHRPHYVDALCNLGTLLTAFGRTSDAVAALEKALAVDSENPDAHWNLGLALIQAGEYADGWREYEWRFRVDEFEKFRRHFDIPAWDGGPLNGKRLLVHAEQGFGDAIQFVRFMPSLAERGAEVVLECRPQLTRLFAGVDGVSEVIDLGAPLPGADLYIPLMSLPARLGTLVDTVPAEMPYLRPAGDAELDNRIEGAPGVKVGLVWAGSPTRRKNQRRSMDPALLQPILDIPGASFFGLQVGSAAAERQQLAEPGQIIDVTDGILDFADTAAIVAGLDLVISVDTAVLHLAGGMGKPAFGLLSRPTGFLWGTDGDASPWYPTIRLFRQPEPGDWDGAVRAAAAALAGLVKHQ
ncbi:MAG: tetratricopeptide repeat protein [Proteobacteria bacterium]|nr:tetratricopeptide repeat protein [Pseudomonadota bacterium]